jgi:hypothetical protein
MANVWLSDIADVEFPQSRGSGVWPMFGCPPEKPILPYHYTSYVKLLRATNCIILAA